MTRKRALLLLLLASAAQARNVSLISARLNRGNTAASAYALAVSSNANHSSPIALNGATLSGSRYVFTAQAGVLTNYQPSGITQVCFWLDNTSMSGTATHCESGMPYDYAGSVSSATNSNGNPWNTGGVANGSHTITQRVLLSGGGAETDTATFTVSNSAPALVITSSTPLPGATNGVSYSTTLAASGGTAPYTWAVTSGTLPTGLSLAGSTGVLSGTPTVNATSSFTVTVTDAVAATNPLAFTLTVSAPSSNAFFAADSFINLPLSSPAIDGSSAQIITASISNGTCASGQPCFQAHLSNGSYGVTLVKTSNSDPTVTFHCTGWSSSTCSVPGTISFHAPSSYTVTAGGEFRASFVNTDTHEAIDCWEYSTGSSTSTDKYCNTIGKTKVGTATLASGGGWGTCAEAATPFIACNSGGYAAGFDGLAGAITAQDIQSGQINHALLFAVPTSGCASGCPSAGGSGYVYPATHTDRPSGSGYAIPEGAQIFLPSSCMTSGQIDAQSWSAWVKLVAHALQNYGAYNVDYAGAFEVKGVSDANAAANGMPTWASVSVPVDGGQNLNMLPWGCMSIVKMVGN